MAVTKLERKGRKNKTVAKVRVATIKRLRTKNTAPSQNKEESGHIVGDVSEVVAKMEAAKAKAPKKEVAPKAEKIEQEAPKAEKVAEKAAEKPAAKKPAAKKPAAKAADKPAAKKPAAKKPATKKPAAKKEESTDKAAE